MSKATPLRELPPGSVWNEAMRRAMVISIAGFFVPNLLANFGVIPQLHQNFQFMPGICGATGVFLASMALFLGYFHHKLIQGSAAAIARLSLPYFSTWFWFRGYESHCLCGATPIIRSISNSGHRHLFRSPAVARKAIELYSRYFE